MNNWNDWDYKTEASRVEEPIEKVTRKRWKEMSIAVLPGEKW